MRLTLALFATVALLSGCVPCQLSSQCGMGQLCVDGECKMGCQTDEDCQGGRVACERSTGLCRLTGRGIPTDLGLAAPDAAGLDAETTDATLPPDAGPDAG